MKLAMILATALSSAPTAPEAPAPENVRIPQGTTFQCTAPEGCYVSNEQGLEKLVREIAARVRAQQCKPRPDL